MKSPWDLAVFVAAMAGATMLTRFLPFLLPARWLDRPFVRALKQGLPAVILLLLVVYCLKDTPWRSAPWGLPELVSLAVVLGLHVWKRNALVSIGVGTGVYMVLVQTGVIGRILGS